jgi:O-antigen ligase
MLPLKEIFTRRHTPLIIALFLLEAVFLAAMFKSFGLAVLLLLFVLCFFLVSNFPEYGLALAATGSVLVMLIFDNIELYLPMPILIIYLFFIFFGLTVFFFKENIAIKFRLKGPQLLSLFLLGLLVFGYSYSTNPSYAIRKIAFYILFNLALVFIPLIFAKDQKRIYNIGYWIYILGIIFGIIATILAISSQQSIRFHASENINPIWLARSLGISAVFSFFVMITLKRRFLKLIVLFSNIVLLFPMIRSWSRAPFIGLLGSLLLMLFLQPKIRKSNKIILGVIGLAVGLFFLRAAPNQITSRMQTPVTEEWSAAFRLLAWYKAYGFFMQSPLLGIGTGSFKLNLPFVPFLYPHNLILEMACENGVLGLLIIILFLSATVFLGLSTIRKAHVYKEKQLAIVLLVAFTYTVWNAMFSGDISSNESVWLFSGLICALNFNLSLKETSPLKQIGETPLYLLR